ncbi:thiaminase /4-amino-5-aminomethyl-2-methylpyrimidine deaminase [Melghiribacillus thermohalophilus]|uniref:Aminopyrimidine aminohydrolase n=1 Tax=Melghiribacillus thermohalophilus TaxID=1324956 RepID=A0A4R3MU87_9BACI|nr:thiaminase II [Melghiribacillus thermohalophilus]TCT20028.1 thiaminase /4-amino-5-aminomethyl-2-methylpyrimidine deaminase [Melghiribacillus thermohalophilus]
MTFADHLKEEAASYWEASYRHPFVTGIADGSLPLTNFRYYVLQDSYYLNQFARVQSLGGARSEDFYTTFRMAQHACGTYEAEHKLHEKFTKLLNITDEEKTNFRPSPTAYAYTSHLFRAAYNGHLGNIIAAILPCYWLYYDIGIRFQGARPEEPIYQEWIQTYGTKWFKKLVDEQIVRLNVIAEQTGENERRRMKENFLISSYYELQFWEMAYRLENWNSSIMPEPVSSGNEVDPS